MEELSSPVYSKEIIEFTTVANQLCILLEGTEKEGLNSFLDKTHKILPLLYLKATLLPALDSSYEEYNERYVTEHDYNIIKNSIAMCLGEYDTFEEVFDPLRSSHDEPAQMTISEQLADIFQDIKNFILLFQIGTEEVMYEAAWDVQQNFEQYWGQKLVNVQRALHNIVYNIKPEEGDQHKKDDNCADDNCSTDTSNWLSQAQNNFKDAQ